MRYTNEQIYENIKWFVETTKQPEVLHVIDYCLGYYGYITKQIRNVIRELIAVGVIKN